MLSVFGFTRRNRILEAARTFLWSSLAVGAGICLLKKHGVKLPFCAGETGKKKEEGCGCGA